MQLSLLSGNKWSMAFLAIFISIVLSVVTSQTLPFRTLEHKLTDWQFQLRGPIEISDSPVVLVAISDQADQEIVEPWPWPRSYHTRLVDNLNAAGARVIGFDVTFLQSDVYSPQNDSLFADAIQRHGNVILAGDIRTEARARSSRLQQYLPPLRTLQLQNPNPWGAITIPSDRDGFIRRYEPVLHHQGNHHFSFAFEVVRKYLDLDTLFVKNTGSHYDMGFVRIPVFNEGGMLINYHGGTGTFTEFHYDQIIDDGGFLLSSDREFFGLTHTDEKDFGDFDDPDPEFGLLHSGALKGKIVIVGATIPELQDFHSTPVSPRLAGYMIQANVIQTILSENFIASASRKSVLFLILVISIIITLTTLFKGVAWGLSLMTLIATALLVGAYFLFSGLNIHMVLVMPMLTLLFGFAISATYSFTIEQREKRRIRKIFGSYVSPELVNTLIESGEDPQLGGNEVYMTAFFSDIRSFSTMSEKLPPSLLVELMNEYLSEMTDILIKEQGTLDKYIGDAIVAFYGAPVPVEDHALRACITSQHMQLKQIELRERWKTQGDQLPEIISQMNTRIGINTGWMITGNMGSNTRFNYTIMGDNVNLAARCESGAKLYGVYTMVTSDTKTEAEKFGNDCVFRYLDKIIVIGRSQPVDVYEIAGFRSMLDAKTFQCIEIYESGMIEYQNQNWDKAIRLFTESSLLEPNQPSAQIETNPSLVMIERSREMMLDQPDEEWDGVFVMKSK